MGALTDSSPNAVWRADDITGLSNGDNVTSWSDSESSNDATSAGAVHPTYVTGATPLGEPAVRWPSSTASSCYMTSALNSYASTQTVIAVVKLSSSASHRTIVGSSSTAGLQHRVRSGGNQELLRQSTTALGQSTSAVTDGSWTILTATINTASGYAFRMDGTAVGSGSLSTSFTGPQSTTIGRNTVASGEQLTGDVAIIARWTRVLSSTEITDIEAELTAVFLEAPANTGAGDVTAPAAEASGSGTVGRTGTGAVTAPAAEASGAGTVTIPGSGAVTAPAATGSGTGINGAQVGSGAVTAPAATASGTGTVWRTATGDVTAPAATASGAGTVTITGVGDVTAPAATASGNDLSADTVLEAPVLTTAAIVSWEAAPAVPEVDILCAPVETAARLRSPLVLATPPDGRHDILRQAHLMPALSAVAPVRKGVHYDPGVDSYLYEIETATAGRAHVFVNGEDVTFQDGKGALVRDRSSSVPIGPGSASIQFPTFQPWDRTGTGDWDWCDLSTDPQIDLVFRHDDGTEEHVWEGFGAAEAEGTPGLLVQCEGIFYQAAHAPWDPPVVMEQTDIGHVIADALNGVKHRRWYKIPRVTTGITTSDRGRQGQSVWQYVQDILALAFTAAGRQWTLARVAPYTYRIQLKKAMSTVDWTVTHKAPGVEVRLGRDQSVRRDAIYGRGYDKDGGYWCGRVFPGLEFGVPPQYPMTNTSLTLNGRTDATTDTGNGITVWQRKMRELGYSITVDGDMGTVDTTYVSQIQRARGILVDGILGPQTWAATWENNSTDADLTSYRLPLASRTEVQEWLYSASGAKIARNPDNDPQVIPHEMPEVDFGEGISKSRAKVLAERMLDLEQDPPWTGTVVLTTDPWEASSSRFLIEPGDNVQILGHAADVVQVSEVSQSGTSVTLTVATRALDALSLEAIRERNVTARRDAAGRRYTLNQASLNKAEVVQYESESRAGSVPRTAVNGDVGLWTIRKTFVSQVGVAKVEFDATGPESEIVVALFNRPIRTSVLASLVPDPLSATDGWYDNVETLQTKYGLMEVYGSPGNPGGYWPKQKGIGSITGKLRESGALPYSSPYGGFVWVAMFTSQSCWVDGRVFPAVPT